MNTVDKYSKSRPWSLGSKPNAQPEYFKSYIRYVTPKNDKNKVPF